MASFVDGTIDGYDVVEAHELVSLGHIQAMLTAPENIDYEILVDLTKVYATATSSGSHRTWNGNFRRQAIFGK